MESVGDDHIVSKYRLGRGSDESIAVASLVGNTRPASGWWRASGALLTTVDASFGEAFAVANRQKLNATVGVMDERAA